MDVLRSPPPPMPDAGEGTHERHADEADERGGFGDVVVFQLHFDIVARSRLDVCPCEIEIEINP